MAKCWTCGTIYDGWSCPVCSAKEDLEQQKRDLEESTEEMQSAMEETLREQERMLEAQREEIESAIEQSQLEMEAALEEAASEHKKTTSEAWKLQAEAKVDRAYELYTRADLNEEAIKLCLEAISQDPGNIRAYRIAGWAYRAIGQETKAKDLLKKQISLLRISEYNSEEHALEVLQDIFRIQNKEDLGSFCVAFLAASNVFGYFPASLIDELIKHSLYVVAQMLYQNTLEFSETLLGHAYGIELNNKTLSKQDTGRLIKFLSNLPYTQRNDLFKTFKGIKNSSKLSESTIDLLRKEIIKRHDQWKPEIENEIRKNAKEYAKEQAKGKKKPAVIGWITGIGGYFVLFFILDIIHGNPSGPNGLPGDQIGLIFFFSIAGGIFVYWKIKQDMISGFENENISFREKQEKETLLNTLGERIEYDGIENFLVTQACKRRKAFKQWGIIIAILIVVIIIIGFINMKEISQKIIFGSGKRNIASNSYPTRQSPSTNGSPSSQPDVTGTDTKNVSNLSGKWEGNYIDKDVWGREYQVGFELELTQNGAQITGIITERRDYRTLTAQIDGTVKGRTIRFAKQYNEEPRRALPIQYEGSITADGGSVIGTWQTSISSGRWSISRASKNPLPKSSEAMLFQPSSQAPTISQPTEKITIDSLTKNIPDTNYFVAKSKIFDASFDIVWSAANEYLKKDHVIDIFDTSFDIDISDRNKGILTTKRMISTKQITSSLPSFLRASPTSPKTYKISYQTFILIEKISEDSTKVTVKRFSYNYFQNEWYKPWGRSFGEIDLGGIEKEIKKEVK